MNAAAFIIGTAMSLATLTSSCKDDLEVASPAAPDNVALATTDQPAIYELDIDLTARLYTLTHATSDNQNTGETGQIDENAQQFIVAGSGEATSSTFGKMQAVVSLKYTEGQDIVTGTITLKVPNSDDELRIELGQRQFSDLAAEGSYASYEVSSARPFAGKNFSGTVTLPQLDQVLNNDENNAKSSIKITGNLK